MQRMLGVKSDTPFSHRKSIIYLFCARTRVRVWCVCVGVCVYVYTNYIVLIILSYLQRSDKTTLNKGRIVVDEEILLKKLENFAHEKNLKLVVSSLKKKTPLLPCITVLVLLRLWV